MVRRSLTLGVTDADAGSAAGGTALTGGPLGSRSRGAADRNRSNSARAQVHGPVPPRRPAGTTRPSDLAFRRPAEVLKPQYLDAIGVDMNAGQLESLVCRGAVEGAGLPSERAVCSSASAHWRRALA